MSAKLANGKLFRVSRQLTLRKSDMVIRAGDISQEDIPVEDIWQAFCELGLVVRARLGNDAMPPLARRVYFGTGE